MSKAVGATLIAVVLVAGLLALWVFGSGRADFPGLDRSVIGIEALTGVLEAKGIATERSNPRFSPRLQDLGLRILPLYDTDPTVSAKNKSAPGATTLRDIDFWVLIRKLDDMPTLVIVPKWRAAAAIEGIAAPQTMIPVMELNKLVSSLGLDEARLTRSGARFQVVVWPPGHSITLFAAQLFDPKRLPDNCTARVTFNRGVLVAECDWHNGTPDTWLLSDPDLMNNHGLTNGDNAAAAAALVRLLRNDNRPVYLDTSTAILTEDASLDERQDYVRSTSDLARFFAPPFDALWAMLLITLGLMLWRGAVRFGPVRADDDDGGIEQSKTAAISVRARLLRLAGQDGRMVADYVRADLSRAADAAFGKGKGDAGRLYALLARRNAGDAARFRTLAEILMQDDADPGAAELIRQLTLYRSLSKSLTHGNDPSTVSTARPGPAR